ncbi:hypothetical protein EDB98_105274 [Pseudomonas fluorescens]|nr:hypothetical protein EDB98_105274 [Pseudomonas fluorescens]SFW73409.1 hypothetical protein SAMN03159439_04162 [Pseudomonas sp. NFACC04-2]
MCIDTDSCYPAFFKQKRCGSSTNTREVRTFLILIDKALRIVPELLPPCIKQHDRSLINVSMGLFPFFYILDANYIIWIVLSQGTCIDHDSRPYQ